MIVESVLRSVHRRLNFGVLSLVVVTRLQVEIDLLVRRSVSVGPDVPRFDIPVPPLKSRSRKRGGCPYS